jgi:Na+/H+ antiporter NhaD/arsenite permease-like protein
VLAMASTLAGNLTITGSVANIIVVESAKPGAKIGFWEYFRVGLPITVMTLIVGWAWLECRADAMTPHLKDFLGFSKTPAQVGCRA